MTASNRHILIINHTRERHGSEHVMLETLRQCRAQGWRVTLVLPVNRPDGGLAQAVGEDTEILYLNYKNSGEGLLRSLAIELYNLPALVRLVRWIRKHPVDAIYTNTSVMLLGLEAARWTHTPHIWHWHELPTGAFGWPKASLLLLRHWWRRSTRILFISRLQQEQWQKALGTRIDNGQVIYNPVRTIRATHKTTSDTLRVGYIGSMEPRKNLDWLKQTVSSLTDEYAIRLDLYGAEQALTDGTIQIHPFTPDVTSAYADMDIFVLPSWSETMPLVVLEAMQAGVCVLQTNQSGMPQIMQDGDTCLFINPYEPDGLRTALIRCMDAAFRTEMATRGQRFVQQWMVTHNYAQQIIARFNQCFKH